MYVYSGRGIWIRGLNIDYEDSFCLSPPPFDWLRQTPVGEVRSSDTPLTLVALQWTPTTDMDGKSHIVTHSKKILKTNTQNKSVFFSISFVVFFIYVVHFFAIGKSLKRGVLSFGNCPTGISDDIVSFLEVVSLGAGTKKDISSWVGGGDRSPVFAAGPINFPSFARCPNAPATLPPVPIILRSSPLSLPNTNHCTTFSSVLIQSMVCNSYRAHFPTPVHPRPQHLHLTPCQCPSLYTYHCGVSVLDWIV